jgi:glycosyltransferase involved in cell wall biosynthesis
VEQRLAGTQGRKLIRFQHPPFGFDVSALQPAASHAGTPPRLLCFGRLLPYKGLDLLAEALSALPPDLPVCVRVVGFGPESSALSALRACRCVTVENRWVPEPEIGALLAWSDALILPYREASQSGVAAAALAAGRPVIATRVGGLREQLSGAAQAVLCEPEAASLSRAIRLWLEAPAHVAEPVDASAAWRDAVSALLQAIATAMPRPLSRTPSSPTVRPARRRFDSRGQPGRPSHQGRQ